MELTGKGRVGPPLYSACSPRSRIQGCLTLGVTTDKRNGNSVAFSGVVHHGALLAAPGGTAVWQGAFLLPGPLKPPQRGSRRPLPVR